MADLFQPVSRRAEIFQDGGPGWIASRGRVRVLLQIEGHIHARAGREFSGAVGEIPRFEHQASPILAHRDLEMLLLHDGGFRGHFHAEHGADRRRVAVTERGQQEEFVDGLLADLAQLQHGADLQARQKIAGAETRAGVCIEQAKRRRKSWIHRPLVSQNLVGGEDAIDDAGLSLSRILPSPKGLFLEGTAQVFRGDSTNVFSAGRRRDVAAVGHLRAYSDLSESTNIDFGASYARGHSPFADGNNQLYGADATLRWKPLRRAIYHSFVARSEFVWARPSFPPAFLAARLLPPPPPPRRLAKP